jgi:hypothetical protein
MVIWKEKERNDKIKSNSNNTPIIMAIIITNIRQKI